jgi:eukaryotic-like serine/threonine-protein kinase
VLVTLLILAILGVFLWLLAKNLLNNDQPTQDGNGQQVAVPDVVGQSFFDARKTLEAQGFTLGRPIRKPPEDDTQVTGTVLEQNPAAGDKVDEGSEVILTVVGEATQIAVPDLPEGSSAEEASALLTDAGLTPGDTVPTASDTVAVDDVIGFDPASGTEIDPATPVNILVSTGPEQVTVPDVTCRSFASAVNILSRAGLHPIEGTTTVDANPNCTLGDKVAAQDPAAGEVVDPDTTVTLSHGAETQPTGPSGGTGTT